MDQAQLLEHLFDPKKLRLLRHFLTHPDRDFTLQEASIQTNVPLATAHRLLKQLTALGLVEAVRIKHLKMYRLGGSEHTAYLEQFLTSGKRTLEAFAADLAQIPGVEDAIIHGKEQEDRANILIIGRNISHQQVKELCARYQEQGYTVTQLILEPEQYDQMSAMGLYSGGKKSLLRR